MYRSNNSSIFAFPLSAFVGALTVLAPLPSFAQAAPVITAEGIQNGNDRDIDAHRRAPVISVGTDVQQSSGIAKLSVDAFVPDSDYAPYPVRFDFFVNGELQSSQIRSPQLNRGLGIDVSLKEFPLPFNYTVVGTVIHPNRSFSSVIEGAVFSSTFTGSLDCTVTQSVSADGTPETFTASAVQASQTGNDAFSLDFDATNDNGDTGHVVSALSVTNGKGNGSLTLTVGGSPTTQTVSGTVTQASAGGDVSAIDVAASDKSISLSCSQHGAAAATPTPAATATPDPSTGL